MKPIEEVVELFTGFQINMHFVREHGGQYYTIKRVKDDGAVVFEGGESVAAKHLSILEKITKIELKDELFQI